jgi:cytochrome P450 family 4
MQSFIRGTNLHFLNPKRNPDTLQQILIKDDINLFTKGSGYDDLIPWLGNGILLSDGAAWKHKRKLMSHAFSLTALKNLIPIFTKCADELVKVLDELPDGAEVNVLELLTSTTLNIIGLAAFSYSFDALSSGPKSKNETTKAFHGVLSELRNRFMIYMIFPTTLWLYGTPSGWRYRQHIAVLHDTANRIIHRRLEARKNNEIKSEEGKDILDYLIDATFEESQSKEIPRESLELLRDEIMTFLFAGHDTT